LDAAFGHRRMPLVVRVEVAQERPHLVDGRIDDRAADDRDHAPGQRRPAWRFRGAKPAWNTPVPVWWPSSCSRAGWQWNAAVHSAKVRSPSVIGVSLRLAV